MDSDRAHGKKVVDRVSYFWEATKLLRKTMQILLFHIDEKGNAKDAAMFSPLTKEVLAIGGLENGGRQLAGDKLWKDLQ